MYGVIANREKNALHWLLHFDVVRGEHSTGVLAVHENKGEYSTHVYKELGRPEELYDTYDKDFKDDIYQPLSPLCLMGHNRHATQGAITKDTAHPFEYDNVIGAHNGTVYPFSLYNLNGYKKWDIDSQILFQHINDTGNVQEVWDVADGAIALTWWDKKDNSLKIVRNNQRPLYWCTSKDGKTLFWASQSWMLSAALGKCGIQFEKIESFPTDKVFTFSRDDKGVVKVETEHLNPFVKTVGFLGYTGGNSSYNYKSSKKSWFRLTEFVKEGPKEFQGYFVGIIEDDKKEEVILNIDSPVENIQKARYSRIMEFWEDRIHVNQPAIYSFYEDDLDIDKSYWKISEWYITKVYGGMPSTTKEIPANHIEIEGKLFDEKQFGQEYKDGCCLCGTCVPFEEVKDSLFIKGELICKECKEEDMVKEWLDMDHSTNQGKVA